jgi:hypothetical protein
LSEYLLLVRGIQPIEDHHGEPHDNQKYKQKADIHFDELDVLERDILWPNMCGFLR